MEAAIKKKKKIDKEFGDQFGRYYGGAISEYKTEDADVVIVTIGGMTGTGMDAVDLAREEGIKAGLIKLRFTRPFPAKRIAKAMEGKKAFAVIDRSVSFGWSTGPFSVIGGLGGADISLDMILSTIRKLNVVKEEPGQKDTQWYMVD